jgi:hypothetical protein
MVETTKKLKTECVGNANIYLQLITYIIKCSGSLKSHGGTSAKNRQKEGSFLSARVSEFTEFEFLLIEAPRPRLLKKTKHKVFTGQLI